MTISEAMSKCHKAGIKVYGISFTDYYQVEIVDKSVKNGKPVRYKKRLTSNKDLNEAVTKTYFHQALLVDEKINEPTKN